MVVKALLTAEKENRAPFHLNCEELLKEFRNNLYDNRELYSKPAYTRTGLQEMLEEQNLTEVPEEELDSDLDDEDVDIDNLETDGLFDTLLEDDDLDPNALLGDIDTDE